MKRNNIFPCITPESYLVEAGTGNYVAWDLGHGLVTMLWTDQDGDVVKSISPADLQSIGLSAEDAFNSAFENLNQLLNQGAIPFEQVGFPGNETILVAGPHWLASALVLHGGLHGFVAEQVGSQQVRVVIPERDRVIFFSRECSAFVRDAVKTIASDMSLASRKGFAAKAFEYSIDAATPAAEI